MLEPQDRSLRAVLAALIFGVLTVGIYAPLPGTGRLSICVFHEASGLPCPLCGGTRAARALAQGDIARAIDLNPLALLAVTLLAAAGLALAAEAISGRRILFGTASLRAAKAGLPVLLVLLGVWWALHVYAALRDPESELVDRRHPVAAAAAKVVSPR